MDEQKMPRRPRRDHDGEQPQKSESLVYGKNPVTAVSYTHLTLPTTPYV